MRVLHAPSSRSTKLPTQSPCKLCHVYSSFYNAKLGEHFHMPAVYIYRPVGAQPSLHDIAGSHHADVGDGVGAAGGFDGLLGRGSLGSTHRCRTVLQIRSPLILLLVGLRLHGRWGAGGSRSGSSGRRAATALPSAGPRRLRVLGRLDGFGPRAWRCDLRQRRRLGFQDLRFSSRPQR